MSELPKGWVETDIGTVARYINGRGFKESEWRSDGIPIIRIQNLTKVDAPFNYSDAEHEEKYRVSDGDLLVAWAATLGVYIWNRGPAWLNQHIFRVEVEERVILKPFLQHSLTHALDDLYDRAHGSGMVHIKRGAFESRPLLLPPIQEQARIVSKIDELFSSIDEGERALERVRKLVERYRQSVLKAAVTGELTREWREQNAGELESGEALLNRILEARRQAWEQSELAKMSAKGIRPTNDNWKKKHEAPSESNVSHLPRLPDKWVWSSLGQLGEVSGGLTKNKSKTGQTLTRPYLRVANVYRNRLDLEDVQSIPVTEGELERLTLQKNDLLVVEGNGSLSQIGRAALWDGSIEDCIHQNHIIKVRVSSPELAWYALIWCMSPDGRQVIEDVASSTAGLHTLSISKIQAIPIPLPTEQELSLIRNEFDRLDSIITAQLRADEGTSRKAKALKQGVLKSAFSGHLVPQDPTDEPASVLLDRIAAERVAAPKRVTAKKRTGKRGFPSHPIEQKRSMGTPASGMTNGELMTNKGAKTKA